MWPATHAKRGRADFLNLNKGVSVKETERLNGILNELGRLDGIADLRLSPSGTAALHFQGGKDVFFEYAQEARTLFIYTPLFSLPEDPDERGGLLQTMLRANFLKLDTGPGELSLDAEADKAIYQIGVNIDHLSANLLDRLIGELLTHASALRLQLQFGKAPQTARPRTRESTSKRLRRFANIQRA